MTEYVYMPFPKDLYNKIVIRSDGKIDPSRLAINEVEGFIQQTWSDPDFWSESGRRLFAKEHPEPQPNPYGEPSRGYQWQQLFLPNGTELRMTYKGRNFYAQVQNERVTANANSYSPSQWVREVAENTSRNAWRDIWVRMPGEHDWKPADRLRKSEAKLQNNLM